MQEPASSCGDSSKGPAHRSSEDETRLALEVTTVQPRRTLSRLFVIADETAVDLASALAQLARLVGVGVKKAETARRSPSCTVFGDSFALLPGCSRLRKLWGVYPITWGGGERVRLGDKLVCI